MAKSKAQLDVEGWVRDTWLPARFAGTRFEKRDCPVGTKKDGEDALHEFDAVATNGRILASVKASSGRTSGGKYPSAKVSIALAEILYLTRAKGDHKLLVLTDPELHRMVTHRADGLLDAHTEIVLAEEMPADLRAALAAAQKEQSDEMS